MELDVIDPSLSIGLTALSDAMRTNGYQRDNPVRAIPALIGDRWTTLILLTLAIGTFRHAELLRAISRLSAGAEGKISQRILTSKLRVLEYEGLVLRTATDNIPPKVSYGLTEMGKSLVYQIRSLQNWVFEHKSIIEKSRIDFQKRNG